MATQATKPLWIPPPGRALAAAAALSLSLAASPRAAADGALAVGWRSVAGLFRQRYAERAGGRIAPELARLQERLAAGTRLDPVVASQLSRDVDSKDTHLDTSLTQGSPFGTELKLSESRSDLETIMPAGDQQRVQSVTTGVTLTQQLLKGGPYQGLSADRAAALQGALDDDKAATDLDEGLYKAVTALLEAQQATGELDAARHALASAESQHAAVSELVRSGFKAKADLLVSEAAVLRSRLTVDLDAQRTDNALRDLGTALLQRSGDPPLALSPEMASDAELRSLETLAWPAEPRTVRTARLAAELAQVRAGLAARDDLPTLGVSVGVTKTRRDVGLPSPTVDRVIGLSFSMPLVSGIRRDAAQQAALRAAAADSDFAQNRSDVLVSRADLEAQAGVARTTLEVAGKLLDLDRRTLEIEQQKYADGKSTILDLRRVQEEVDQQTLAVIAARKQAVVSRLALARAAGRLAEVLP
jgi:outer membrane protein TolC